jgi:hypothetical protein
MKFIRNISLANIPDGSPSHVLLIYENSLLFSLRCARNKICNFVFGGKNTFLLQHTIKKQPQENSTQFKIVGVLSITFQFLIPMKFPLSRKYLFLLLSNIFELCFLEQYTGSRIRITLLSGLWRSVSWYRSTTLHVIMSHNTMIWILKPGRPWNLNMWVGG